MHPQTRIDYSYFSRWPLPPGPGAIERDPLGPRSQKIAATKWQGTRMISEAQAHLKLGGLRVGPAGEPFVVGHEPTESEVNTQYVTEHSLDHAVCH